MPIILQQNLLKIKTNRMIFLINKMQRVGFALNKQGEEGSKDKTGRNTDETRLDMS